MRTEELSVGMTGFVFRQNPAEVVFPATQFACLVVTVMMWSDRGVDEEICTSLLRSYALENSVSYPMLIGADMDLTTKVQLTLFLVSLRYPAANTTTPSNIVMVFTICSATVEQLRHAACLLNNEQTSRRLRSLFQLSSICCCPLEALA